MQTTAQPLLRATPVTKQLAALPNQCIGRSLSFFAHIGLPALVLTHVTFLGGCASAPSLHSETTSLSHNTQIVAPYVLSDAEKSLDCATMRGRMQVALLELQTNPKMPQNSSLSRAMQGSIGSIMGGADSNADTTLSTARKLARLQAYNGWLKTQDCKTFDLEKELANQQKNSPVS